MLTVFELAQMLNGRSYGNEMTPDMERRAKEAGLVVVFGASDDLIEFRGAWNDERDVYEGGFVAVNQDGILPHCDNYDCPYYRDAFRRAEKIEAVWCGEGDVVAWTYKTKIPHVTFIIMDEGEVYCRGIIFHSAFAAPPTPAPATEARDECE